MAATRGGYEAVISGSALPLNLLCLAFRHAAFEASLNISKASVTVRLQEYQRCAVANQLLVYLMASPSMASARARNLNRLLASSKMLIA